MGKWENYIEDFSQEGKGPNYLLVTVCVILIKLFALREKGAEQQKKPYSIDFNFIFQYIRQEHLKRIFSFILDFGPNTGSCDTLM